MFGWFGGAPILGTPSTLSLDQVEKNTCLLVGPYGTALSYAKYTRLGLSIHGVRPGRAQVLRSPFYPCTPPPVALSWAKPWASWPARCRVPSARPMARKASRRTKLGWDPAGIMGRIGDFTQENGEEWRFCLRNQGFHQQKCGCRWDQCWMKQQQCGCHWKKLGLTFKHWYILRIWWRLGAKFEIDLSILICIGDRMGVKQKEWRLSINNHQHIKKCSIYKHIHNWCKRIMVHGDQVHVMFRIQKVVFSFSVLCSNVFSYWRLLCNCISIFWKSNDFFALFEVVMFGWAPAGQLIWTMWWLYKLLMSFRRYIIPHVYTCSLKRGYLRVWTLN